MKTRVYDRRIYISMRKGLSFAVLFMYLEMLAACGAGIFGNVLDDTIDGQYDVSCLQGGNTRCPPVNKEVFVFRRGVG